MIKNPHILRIMIVLGILCLSIIAISLFLRFENDLLDQLLVYAPNYQQLLINRILFFSFSIMSLLLFNKKLGNYYKALVVGNIKNKEIISFLALSILKYAALHILIITLIKVLRTVH